MRPSYVAVLMSMILLIGAGPSKAGAPSGETEQGLDMILVDAAAFPQEPELADGALDVEDVSWSGAPVDLVRPVHHIYTDLRRQLLRYQLLWGSLPQVRVPVSGPPLEFGAENRRISILRQRLGIAPQGSFDKELEEKIARFQTAHGLKETGRASDETLAVLNRGAAYYERRLLLNMERARRLPAPGTVQKYIFVDAGSARLWMYENGLPVDSMRVIVGKSGSETPMLAALLRFASVNPYWNVPPDLVASLIAPKVLVNGVGYLKERRYEVLDSWEDSAKVINPGTIDWHAVAKGTQELRVRQLPGGANSMGSIKFMMPNEYGIYLHDTPNKALFAEENRWISNGCVRLEDAERLARWVFGSMPRGSNPDREDQVPLQEAIPVYLTYLTVGRGQDGPQFRADPYNRDNVLLRRFADSGDGMEEAKPSLEVDFAKLDTRTPKPEPVRAKDPTNSVPRVIDSKLDMPAKKNSALTRVKVLRPNADAVEKEALAKAVLVSSGAQSRLRSPDSLAPKPTVSVKQPTGLPAYSNAVRTANDEGRRPSLQIDFTELDKRKPGSGTDVAKAAAAAGKKTSASKPASTVRTPPAPTPLKVTVRLKPAIETAATEERVVVRSASHSKSSASKQPTGKSVAPSTAQPHSAKAPQSSAEASKIGVTPARSAKNKLLEPTPRATPIAKAALGTKKAREVR